MTAIVESVSRWVDASLSFVYPEICQVCRERRATPAESYVCAECRALVQAITPPYCERCGLPFEGAISQNFECANCRGIEWHFTQARSAVIARGAMLEIIHQYKYRRALWFEPFLAELLIRQAGPELLPGRWDLVVPVPLHPARQREREFNQAERLARRLSLATRIPLNPRLLCRIRPTQTQTRLSRDARRRNVRHAFAFRGRRLLDRARVVLVDDVFTTGSTTDACARVLLESGAAEVSVWTLARGV